MKIILGSDKEGNQLKEFIKHELEERGFDIMEATETPADNFVDSVAKIVSLLRQFPDSLAIAFDAYGAGSFMAATKHEKIIAAEISDERSAYMTREHNNARMITLGSQIVGEKLALNITLEFLKASYDGGRHQIRVDMLNKMR